MLDLGLITEPQLGKESPLREGMKNPVFVVIDIVDAADSGQLLRDPVLREHIGNKIAGYPGVGEAISVGIIQLAKLAAAVADIHRSAQIIVCAISHDRISPPGRKPGLMFAGGGNGGVGIGRCGPRRR